MDEAAHRSRDPEHTRGAVIDAAEKLFSERGFAATSMRDISGVSGVSHPLIHHHFGSKEALYSAVKRRMVEGYARRFPQAARVTHRGLNVRAEMRRILVYLSENPVLVRLCAWARLEGDVRVWPGEPDLLETLRQKIEVDQANGRVRIDLNAEALSVIVLGLVLVWVENRRYFQLRFPGKLGDQAFLKQAVSFVQQGIAPPLASTQPTRAKRAQAARG